jgi:hypothetical protein
MTTTTRIDALTAAYATARAASAAAQAAASAVLAPLYERDASEAEYVAARDAAGLPSAAAEAQIHRAMEHARSALASALRVAAQRTRRSFGDASDTAIVAAHMATI